MTVDIDISTIEHLDFDHEPMCECRIKAPDCQGSADYIVVFKNCCPAKNGLSKYFCTPCLNYKFEFDFLVCRSCGYKAPPKSCYDRIIPIK